MSKITSDEIRQRFLDYFVSRGHLQIGSASLIPIEDPTLLLINSGMAPLKSYFTGEKTSPQKRLCNVQKCIRTNDIDSVGDRHHLTFFEMMGNWSIGDYFKKEAIAFAWELIKDVFGFDTSRLYATVYGGDKSLPSVLPDEESKKIWSELLPSERIVSLGAQYNFWGPAGEIGPCGPCTEIFIDRGEEYGCGKPTCGPDCSCGRFLEIWNGGVFMQYYLHEDKTLTELPLKSVDAGAGLERFAVILQRVDSVYEIDLIRPIMEVFSSEKSTGSICSVRIITDHIRCATFMIAEGILPGNTRMEYVLRRIIRRALIHANLTEIDQTKLQIAAGVVIDVTSRYYPEAETARTTVSSVLDQETTVFNRTLKRGMREFVKIAEKSVGMITGENAFRLYDALGFPFELTKELAGARNLCVDETRFITLLEEQRQRSRSTAKHK